MADVGGIAGDRLKSFIERIERLEEEKKTLQADIKEVYAEAKGTGYDVKVLRKVVALRKRDLDERKEEEAILDLYLQARRGVQAIAPWNPFASLMPFGANSFMARPPEPMPQAPPPPRPTDDVADLRRELEELKRSMKKGRKR